MIRKYSTIFNGNDTTRRKLPVSLKHKTSAFHYRLLTARIAVLQRMIPNDVPLSFNQLSYCVYIDRSLKVPERLLPKLGSYGYIKQEDISNRGYNYIVKEIERMKDERTVRSLEIHTNSFISKPILTDFMRQFNKLIQIDNLGYIGCLNDEFSINDFLSLNNKPNRIDLNHLPQMIMPKTIKSTGIKIPRTERHRILTSIIGMISIEHPEKVDELIRNWLFLGYNGNHRGLLDLVMNKWNRF